MSQRPQYVQFFFQLADLGCTIGYPQLRDGARHLLQLVPPDSLTVSRLQWFFGRFKENEPTLNDESNVSVGSLFFTASPSQVLYNLEVLYTLLMPALDPMSERACEFQLNLIKSGEASVILDMLTKNNFLPNADETTKRSAYLVVLKLCKLLLTVMANVMALLIEEGPYANLQANHDNQVNKVVPTNVLKQALHNLPNQNEFILKSVGVKLATCLANEMVMGGGSELERCRRLVLQALSWELPDVPTIRAIIRLAWAASSGSLNHVNAPAQVLHEMHETNAREQRTLDNNDVLGMKFFYASYLN